MYAKAEAQPTHVEHDLLDGDKFVNLKCSVRTIGISVINDVFPKLFQLDHDTTASIMSDTSATLAWQNPSVIWSTAAILNQSALALPSSLLAQQHIIRALVWGTFR